MNERLNKLLDDNEVVLAGLYVDPRFNFEGIDFYSEHRQNIAQV